MSLYAELLYAELLNYAKNQRRVVNGMSMLDEVASEAARTANAQTQPAGFDTEVDIMDVEPIKSGGSLRQQTGSVQHVKTVGRKDA